MYSATKWRFSDGTNKIRLESSLRTKGLRRRYESHGQNCGIALSPRIGHNDAMDIRSSLKDSIAKSLGGLGISVEAGKIRLEHPAELKNGDYSSGVALQYAKQAGTAPRALAE